MILMSKGLQLQGPDGPYPWSLSNGIGGSRRSPRAALSGSIRLDPETSITGEE